MTNKIISLLCCISAVICILTGCFNVSAESSRTDTENIIDEIIDCMVKKSGASSVQEWIDGELSQNAGSGSEWYIITLSRYDPSLDFTGYAEALESNLKNISHMPASSRERCALALAACGRRDSEFVSDTVENSIGKQGIMSLIFGLHLLNNGLVSGTYTVESLTDEIISLKLTDGGWAITGKFSDIDVTSMVIQAMAPQYGKEEDVTDAIDGALTLISGKQLPNGGFQSYGKENAESAAQVITAFSSIGKDARKSEETCKNGHSPLDSMLTCRLSDGSFSHYPGSGSFNPLATEQALYSLVSLKMLENGNGPILVFNKESSTPAQTDTGSGSESDTGDTGDTSDAGTHIPDVSGQNPEQGRESFPVKYIIYISVAAVGILICIIMFASGKRNIRNYILTAVITAAVLLIVFFSDIKSPDKYYGSSDEKENASGTVTMSITCHNVKGKKDSEFIPSDGIILPETEFKIDDDDTAFDILKEAARKYSIQLEFKGTSSSGLAYVTGINYLYEFDFGDLSGWVYLVNGKQPSVGCAEYVLSDKDRIEWAYTCDLGEDLK